MGGGHEELAGLSSFPLMRYFASPSVALANTLSVNAAQPQAELCSLPSDCPVSDPIIHSPTAPTELAPIHLLVCH